MTNELIGKLKQLDIIYRKRMSLKNEGVSDYYIDIKKAYGYPEMLNLISDELWKKVDKGITCIATGGYGGLPIAAVISAKHNLNLTLVREKPKEHGKVGWIDGYTPNEEDKIAIIDDVLTTGKSLREIITALRPTGAEILGCYVVVKRGEGDLPVPLEHLIDQEELL